MGVRLLLSVLSPVSPLVIESLQRPIPGACLNYLHNTISLGTFSGSWIDITLCDGPGRMLAPTGLEDNSGWKFLSSADDDDLQLYFSSDEAARSFRRRGKTVHVEANSVGPCAFLGGSLYPCHQRSFLVIE